MEHHLKWWGSTCIHVTICPIFVKLQSRYNCPETNSLNSEGTIIKPATLDNYTTVTPNSKFEIKLKIFYPEEHAIWKRKGKMETGTERTNTLNHWDTCYKNRKLQVSLSVSQQFCFFSSISTKFRVFKNFSSHSNMTTPLIKHLIIISTTACLHFLISTTSLLTITAAVVSLAQLKSSIQIGHQVTNTG